MRRAFVVAGCLALLAGAPAEAAEEALGRLFFTPQQRASLDAGRRIAARPKAESTPAPRRTRALRLDGIVTRSDGERTVWINGRAYHNAAPAGLEIAPTSDPARARINTRSDRKPVEMRVGQELDHPAGRVSEVYAPQRRSAPKSEADQPGASER
jgi:hypothetical protein